MIISVSHNHFCLLFVLSLFFSKKNRQCWFNIKYVCNHLKHVDLHVFQETKKAPTYYFMKFGKCHKHERGTRMFQCYAANLQMDQRAQWQTDFFEMEIWWMVLWHFIGCLNWKQYLASANKCIMHETVLSFTVRWPTRIRPNKVGTHVADEMRCWIAKWVARAISFNGCCVVREPCQRTTIFSFFLSEVDDGWGWHSNIFQFWLNVYGSTSICNDTQDLYLTKKRCVRWSFVCFSVTPKQTKNRVAGKVVQWFTSHQHQSIYAYMKHLVHVFLFLNHGIYSFRSFLFFGSLSKNMIGH